MQVGKGEVKELKKKIGKGTDKKERKRRTEKRGRGGNPGVPLHSRSLTAPLRSPDFNFVSPGR